MRREQKRRVQHHRIRKLEGLENRDLLAADVVSISPAPSSDFVDPSSDIVLEYDENVSAGTGNINISADGSVVETIDITDASKVNISDGTVTITPGAALPADSEITISIDEGAIAFETVALFSEDFEDVEMLGFVSDSEIEGGDNDWSEEVPDGWEADNGETPDGGPEEFFGMRIMNKDRWIETAGDQARSTFTRGTGNVVVADGDEYDDGWAGIGDNNMNVFLTTPEIDLDGVPANTAVLEFDSSFRPEVEQTALVEVSFDDGDSWNELLRINEDNIDGGRSSLARANIREKLPLNNPADATAIVRFGYIDSDNNWWWAFDNVAVEVPGEGDSSPETEWSFNTALGLTPLQNATDVAVDSNLTITFGQDVALTPGLGDVHIHLADGTLVESIPVSSDRVTSDGPTVTIDPVNDLNPNTEYSVTIDDFTIWDTSNANVSGITLFSENFESLALEDSGLAGGLDINHYAVVMEGTLNVTEAGTYTFGVNTDDGSLLAIDEDQDGIDVIDDEVIFDDTTHGAEDRLSTCFDTATCVDAGLGGIDLDVGEYEFEFWYFEGSGGSGGEFFYSKGEHEEFDTGDWALVGDDSQGIGVTEDGITATTYVSALELGPLDEINSLERVEDLIAGDITQVEGFPAEGQLPTADIWNSGGQGRFTDNHFLPGFDAPDPDFDWAPDGPEGWTKDTSFLEENRPGGPAEYFGWNFLAKDFWVAEQGNQNRTDFELGENILALVDPDAYDDFVGINSDSGDNITECEPLDADERTAGGDCGYFTAGLSTPPINLTGLEADTASISFDSSWRDETTQSAEVTVEFFDADGDSISSRQLLRWESMAEDNDYKPAATNETVTIPLENPDGAASAVVTFSMPYAQNDWWWAIDNIRLTSAFPGNPIPGVDEGQWNFTTGDGAGESLPGDINGDRSVNFNDFLILSTNFGQDVDNNTNGDLNDDGKVDFNDFLILSTNFGRTLDAAAADRVFAASS